MSVREELRLFLLCVKHRIPWWALRRELLYIKRTVAEQTRKAIERALSKP